MARFEDGTEPGVMTAPLTYFAPAERASRAQLAAEHQLLLEHPLVSALIDRVPDPILVLNAHRQVVLANRRMADLLGRPGDDLIGHRPGEMLSCVHANEAPGGCGTSRFCSVCGAVAAILCSQNTEEMTVRDCRIQQRADSGVSALDLRVAATRIVVQNATYTLVVAHDISDEKRRQLLERTFFHDLINTASSLQSALMLWLMGDEASKNDGGQRLLGLADQVLEEIAAQRDLLAAEQGQLVVRNRVVDVAQLMEKVLHFQVPGHFKKQPEIRLLPLPSPARIVTDPVLLRRVLGNLLKNAVEASTEGQVVTVGFKQVPWPTFTVHSEPVMPEDVKLQIFQRSFSTKGAYGRGIGSYSVKLLTENYLGGRVSFDTRPGLGTVFTIELLPASSE